MLRKVLIGSKLRESTGVQLWTNTKDLLDTGAVTPFLSNSIATSIFGGEASIAASWAMDEEINSPFSDTENRDLARVTQYYSVRKNDRTEAKRSYLNALKAFLLGKALEDKQVDDDLIQELAQQSRTTTFSQLAHELGYPRYRTPEHNPLRLIAEFPLPIYITTSYHDFLEVALAQTGYKQPVTELFYWDDTLHHIPSIWDREKDYVPSSERPLVYHLYGIDRYPESLILTEDDYLDCLARLTMLRHVVTVPENIRGIPAPVKIAISGRSLLMLGYGIYDWDFRVLFRGLIQATRDTRDKRSIRAV